MSKPRIRVINGTCLDVAEELRDWVECQGFEFVANREIDPFNLEEIIPGSEGFDGIIGPFYTPVIPRYFDSLSDLKVLSLASSGYDGVVDPSAATKAGVVVVSSPAPEGAEVVADMTWGLLLAIVRRIPQQYELAQRGQYERKIPPTVYGKTLGILGLGNIGRAVARRAAGFEMKVIACDTQPKMDFVREQRIELVSFEELLSRSDFLSIHLRLNPDTRGIIGEEELRLMKPTAYLINTARDELVKEGALADALEQKVIAGAATDDAPRVEIERLLHNPNHICTPHLGNRAIEGVRAVSRFAIQNAIDVLQGRRPDHVLNPEVYD
ncbi:MAG: hypothetical protein KC931_15680 [Candidatus Omnitrophica bacterium]|nr:hypothetical protein [Candidatus Omnitrophota bacterium]